jgi:septal ring factor EnvC (AmiA/AmiB activator)
LFFNCYHYEVIWAVDIDLLIKIWVQVEEEKASLQSQCADQQNDLGSLRKELLQAEQTRLDLESDKVSLQEKLKFLEIEKEKVRDY